MVDIRKKRPGKQAITFRDFDLGFRRHPATGKLIIKKDDESIRQAIKYLVLSNKYERPFNPEFGTDLKASLFDNMDGFTESDIQYKVETAIKQYEPRVTIVGDNLGVFVNANPDMNGIIVTIRYKNVSTLTTSFVNINLDRIR